MEMLLNIVKYCDPHSYIQLSCTCKRYREILKSKLEPQKLKYCRDININAVKKAIKLADIDFIKWFNGKDKGYIQEAVRVGNLEIVKCLVNKGYKFTGQEFYKSIEGGNFELIKYLYEFPEARKGKERSQYTLATILTGDVKIYEFLNSKGLLVGIPLEPYVRTLLYERKFKMLEYLTTRGLSKGNILRDITRSGDLVAHEYFKKKFTELPTLGD